MHAPETSLFNSILIICLVLGCILGFFIVSLVRQHRKNVEMYKSKLSAEITTLEKERARIAADLHDDIGPILSVVKFKLANLEPIKGDRADVRHAEEHIDTVIKRLRIISNNLLPSVLLQKGLVLAVQQFIEQTERPGGMCIKFTLEKIPPLHDELCVNLYRIVQEIIHNAIKHAEASEMKINLTATDNKIRLICSDNGKGFDQHKAQKDRAGLGLRNVWSRTELLRGDLFLESSPGKGATYSIELPILKQTNGN